MMEAFYARVAAPESSGAIFLAVCRGKVRPQKTGSHMPALPPHLNPVPKGVEGS